MLVVFFWVIILLLVISIIGGFAYDDRRWRGGTGILVVIELIILGLKVFGFEK